MMTKIIPQNKYILAIDPSINFLGYSVFDREEYDKNKEKKKHPNPILSKLLTSKELGVLKANYIIKSKAMFEHLRGIQKVFGGCDIILEIPEYQGDSSYMARESGSVEKLTFLCGMLCSLDYVITYTPTQWKGQVPKDVMQKRLSRYITEVDMLKLNHNIADAVGIGYYYLTRLRYNKK